jgi:hypothetical protein
MGEDTQNALFVGWSRRAEEYGQLHKGAVVMEDEKRFVPRPAKRGFLIVAEVINAIAGFDALPRALRAAVLGAVYDDRAVLDALLRYKPVRVVRTPDGQGLIAYRSGRRGVRVLACTPSAPGLTEALMDAACRDIGAEGCAWTGHRVASIAPERLERREVSVGTLFAPPGPESGRVTTPMAAEMGDRFPHVVRF